MSLRKTMNTRYEERYSTTNDMDDCNCDICAGLRKSVRTIYRHTEDPEHKHKRLMERLVMLHQETLESTWDLF